MFEKEAEEYATKECCTSCKAINCKEKCECWNFAKKGAEFGYNKANEWHFVKDGDLPRVGQKCYFIYSNLYGEDNKVIFFRI